MRYLQHTALQLLNTAAKVFDQVAEKFGEGDTGGFLCVADRLGNPIGIFFLGRVSDPAERRKVFDYCQEKAVRLGSHPDHMLSWESRNPEAHQWGGAIRARDHIISFSGLPELVDEAFCLSLANVNGLMALPAAQMSVDLSKNDTFEPISMLMFEILRSTRDE